jgi:hypothetical protein
MFPGFSRKTGKHGARHQVFFTRPDPGGRHGRSDPSARGEIADHGGGFGVGGLHHVAQDPVDRVFLKDAETAVSEQVHLVGFQLETALVGNIAQHDFSEIGQPGLRAHRCEFRRNDFDFVIRILVGPGFDFGQRGIHTRPRVFVRVESLHAKALESRSRNRPTSATTPTA